MVNVKFLTPQSWPGQGALFGKMAEAILFAISASQNAVGHLPLREHSYVCATFDFWPSTKCDYGVRGSAFFDVSY